ncbi:hypothetical protein ABKW25_20805 (plasmid) [Enterobacter hormaechei]|jgi:hypothetical protein|uniref:hypothetical protein n=1 Tax=Enterobacterales TaxID=91347 RepID=UPI000643736C|nr:hypothetical protein [Enterobacter genomosp. O]KLP59606.1 hypothetical protein ABR39_01030 [Enterobacter genomosp. O]HDS6669149.1 hypothetical protein [Enterobacter ludwigii]
MNTWLVGFQTQIANIETFVHVLIEAENLEMAEAGAMHMGRTWWPVLKGEDSDHCWTYQEGTVWFCSIILLDDVEKSVLIGLRFLDTWSITGTKERLDAIDHYDNYWEEYTR